MFVLIRPHQSMDAIIDAQVNIYKSICDKLQWLRDYSQLLIVITPFQIGYWSVAVVYTVDLERFGILLAFVLTVLYMSIGHLHFIIHMEKRIQFQRSIERSCILL